MPDFGAAEDDNDMLGEAGKDVVVDGWMTVLPIGTRVVDIIVLAAGHEGTPAEHDVTVYTWVENEVTVTGPVGMLEVETNVVVRLEEDEEDETGVMLGEGDEDGVEDEEDGMMLDEVLGEADEDVEVAGMTVLPMGTRLVETIVLLAGQFVTSEEHDVTVNTCVEKRVTVT